MTESGPDVFELLFGIGATAALLAAVLTAWLWP